MEMEMGGLMSHGAAVAREYGIPAVVGVAGATDQIVTGQRVTVDGASGTVTLVDST
jgi:rifampicin phosphotransferase